MLQKAPGFLKFAANIPAVCWVFLALMAAASVAYYSKEMSFWRSEMEANEADIVRHISRRMGGDFEPAIADLLILSENSELLRYLAHPSRAQRAALEQELLAWSTRKADYYAIRYVDQKGEEVVRVDSDHHGPHVVPLRDLRNVSKRFYFTNTVSLDRQEIYVSPLDLNLLHDKIEQPLHPTVRFCTPVFDSQARKRGVVIFNYEGRKILEEIHAEVENSAGQLMLLNSEGYWLRSPVRDDEWGFMFKEKRDRTFGQLYPGAWAQISAKEAGRFYAEPGFFSFTTLWPLDEASRLVYNKAVVLPSHGMLVSDYSWKVVSYLPRSVIQAQTRKILLRVGLVDVLGLLILGGVALGQTRSRMNRERAAEAIERQAELLDLAQDAIAVRDLKHTILYWNAGAERLYGRTKEEVIGLNYLTVLRAASPTPWVAVWESLLGQGRWSGEATALHKNGTEIVTLNRLALQRDDLGNPAAILSIATDITDRKRADKKIAERTVQLDALVKNNPLGIVVCDQNAVVVMCNGAFERLLGHKVEDIVGRKMNDVLIPEDLKEEVKALNQRVRAGEVVQLFTRRRHRDGTVIDVEAHGVPLVVDGKNAGFYVLYQDIRERKRTEAELHAAKEAAEMASRAKSEFLAMMSHEIRTPMNGVIGMAGLLLDTPLSPEQREYAETVRNSADALLTIINDILDFSKIEAGKMSIEMIPCDLRVAVEEMAELMAGKAREKGLDLILRYSPEAPRHVLADPGRIRQILINLAGNAIKFTTRGHVYVSVECEERSAEHARLRFSVEDTGIGIAARKLGTIFERFTQADSSTTRKFGGTGLGLAISRQLAELMGGTMEVESRAGEGSTFWMVLPLTLDLSPHEIELPKTDLSGIRVLGVDDNPTNLFVLREQLNSWGLRNDMCSSGEDAVRLLRAAEAAGDPYHVAILDQQMPGMDGETLCRTIKADRKLQDTVMVLLTSLGMRGEAARMKDAGFAAYLTKPTRQSQLFDALVAVWSAKENAKAAGLVTRHSLAEMRAIPKPAKALRIAPVDEPTGAERMRGRVLVVEDNAVNQKVASRLLERMAFRVDVAANGSEAVEMMLLLPYDVVLMDCQMPIMDGYEATREVRRREGKGPHRRIIAMTANAMQGDRERCIAAGMDDYISKPIRTSELVEMLDRYVGKQSASSIAWTDSGKPVR